MSYQAYVQGERDLRAQFPESRSLAEAVQAYCAQMAETGYSPVMMSLTTSSQYLFVFRHAEPKAEKHK